MDNLTKIVWSANYIFSLEVLVCDKHVKSHEPTSSS